MLQQKIIPNDWYDNLEFAGRIFFAIALLALGIEHFIYQDFIIGRAPAWPEAIPGGVVWAYLTGTIFIGISIALFTGKKARHAAFLAAALVFVWAMLRHIPVLTTTPFLSGEWTNAGKALRFIGGALAIAAVMPKIELESDGRPLWKVVNLKEEFILVGKICLGLSLLMMGIQHFMFTEFVASLIPEWFPGNAIFWTYFGGVALIAGGTGLLIPQTARPAALWSGIMVFSWFWIIHIPRVLPTPVTVSDSISVFESLVTSGTAFVIAGYLYNQKNLSDYEN